MTCPATERDFARLGLKPVTRREIVARSPQAQPWRITAIDGGMVSAMSLDAEGQLVTKRAQNQQETAVVGDWILLQDSPTSPSGLEIEHVFERVTSLKRGKIVEAEGDQFLAANVDTVWIVTAFSDRAKLENRVLNPRRLQRFVTAVEVGGALPVVVLNKVDLTSRDAAGLKAVARDFTAQLGGVQVILTSVHATEEHHLPTNALASFLVPGATVALLGSSGVGKSSLVNALSGAPVQAVGAVRGSDQKGRHTTIRRQLLPMPGGVWLMDTPGVRAFAMTEEGKDAFADLRSLAATCRFPNCRHETEANCAVQAAVAGGSLRPERLANFRRWASEVRQVQAQRQVRARHAETKQSRRRAVVDDDDDEDRGRGRRRI